MLYGQTEHADYIVTWANTVMLQNRDKTEFSYSTKKLLCLNNNSPSNISEYAKLKEEIEKVKAENLEWEAKYSQLTDEIKEKENKIILQNKLYQERQLEIQKLESKI